MRGRSFLTIGDLSSSEIDTLLDTAREQKAATNGDHRTALAGKTVVLLFDKPSLRTRVSFERATRRLGADALYLSPAEVGLGSREPIKDVARVLSRYCDAIVCRTFGQEVLVELDEYSSVPVINALSDWEHPCQTLADLLTMREHGGTRGRTVTFVGDGNNVARSLSQGAASEGMHVRLVAPSAYTLDGPSVAAARERAASASGSVTLYTDPTEGVRGADIVYTDVWTSMGQEAESAARVAAFAGFQVTTELLGQAGPDAILMHDLPAHRGEEISDEAIEGRQSVVFDQAENRLHAQQALLWHVLR
jgi:ornithine carbamoyltransferase